MSNTMDMRSVMQLLESTSNYSNGVYCSAKPTQSTTDALRSFCAVYDIPNPVPANEMHATIIYSEKGSPNFEFQESYSKDIKAKFAGYELFGEDKNVLVVKMTSPELHSRHNEMMDEFDLSYNFDEYRPHITLSYDAADFDLSKLDPYHGDLMFKGEEANELDKDWKPDDDGTSDT